MVILKEIFDLLAAGEFANVSLSRDETGKLAEKDYPKVVNHLNLGIIEIHKRFNLLQKELTLHVTPDIEMYYLRPEKVSTLGTMGDRFYVLRPDTLEEQDGFMNFVKVLSVFDSDGESLELNNRFCTPNISVRGYDTLKITGLTAAEIYQVEYQAWPEKIVIDDVFDPEDCAIDISDILIEPLLYYIAGRTYKPIGSNDSTANADKSAAYDAKYELALQKLDMYGLDQQYNDHENTFTARGWA